MPVRPGSLTRRQNQTVKMPATHHGTPEAISAPTAAKRCARRLRLVASVPFIQGRLLALLRSGDGQNGRRTLKTALFDPQQTSLDSRP